ncbi:hypothetical protein ACEQPO_30615 [Bacillus sp. SL00103]
MPGNQRGIHFWGIPEIISHYLLMYNLSV